MLLPSYKGNDRALDPHPVQIGSREAFRLLANLDEHPEALPLASDLVEARLSASGAEGSAAPLVSGELDELRELGERSPDDATIDAAWDRLGRAGAALGRPWCDAADALRRDAAVHWLRHLAPTVLVDGCWLEGALRTSTAHTAVGAVLANLYALGVAAHDDPAGSWIDEYRRVARRNGIELGDPTSRTLDKLAAVLQPCEAAFELPSFLLAVGRFPLACGPETLGVDLAWRALGIERFARDCARAADGAGEADAEAHDGEAPHDRTRGDELARRALRALLDECPDDATRASAWTRVVRGALALAFAWSEWLDEVRAAAASKAEDAAHARRAMLALVREKAPHAHGYHRSAILEGVGIDDYLDPDRPQREERIAALLDALARSPWVAPGDARQSPFVARLLAFEGPMYAAFSAAERAVIARWIDTLPLAGIAPVPTKDASDGNGTSAHAAPASHAERVLGVRRATRPMWSTDVFVRRSRARAGAPSSRELYRRLLRLERHPEVLPAAERFALARLERAEAELETGERPLPFPRYDARALAHWVYAKHREQVLAYRPPGARARPARDEFVEHTVQLAPLILVDGAWLRGIPTSGLIRTRVGRKLFRILYEELGEGDPAKHHANVYRALLAAMGVEVPSIHDRAFTEWPRFDDASFDVPAFWLAISCFPRHFLPEILGLNLAVELAGIGGPYLEARDDLVEYGFPTLFVDVHNSADNVATGHVGQALEAIEDYMDELETYVGARTLDDTWRRVWTGVRSPLPSTGGWRHLVRRASRRLARASERPRVFPA